MSIFIHIFASVNQTSVIMRRIKFRGHNGIEWLYDSQISIIPYGKNVHCFMPNEKNKSDQNDVCNWDSVS